MCEGGGGSVKRGKLGGGKERGPRSKEGGRCHGSAEREGQGRSVGREQKTPSGDFPSVIPSPVCT